MEEIVRNSKELVSVFGYWPSFHDGELFRATFSLSSEQIPSLELEIHTFEITKEVDSKGFLVLDKHVLVTIEFRDIKTRSFMEFGIQNVILGLTVEKNEGEEEKDYPISLVIQPAWGTSISLLCKECSILKVEPYIVPA